MPAGCAGDRLNVGGVVVFGPAPLLTVTIEARGDGADVHLHAGGQGFWLARMVAALGVPVKLCASLGGETGAVLRTLIEREGVELIGVDAETANVAYVHDRRSGQRELVAQMTPAPLSRHDVDELYGATLVAALNANVCVLGGPPDEVVVPADTYRRLTTDLHANGKKLVADLSGEPLREAVAGGVDVLKVSDEELVADGLAASDAEDDLVATIAALRSGGVGAVVVSRAERPALAAWDGGVFEVASPHLEPLDPRGAGDSMTAGIAASLAAGEGMRSAVRLGAAAGSLNVARRGLATGRHADIREMAHHVTLRVLGGGDREMATPAEVATLEDLTEKVRPS